MNNNKIKEIEELLRIYEEAIRDLQTQEIDEFVLKEIKKRRDWLVVQYNMLKGPLQEKNKPCFFVKKVGL